MSLCIHRCIIAESSLLLENTLLEANQFITQGSRWWLQSDIRLFSNIFLNHIYIKCNWRNNCIYVCVAYAGFWFMFLWRCLTSLLAIHVFKTLSPVITQQNYFLPVHWILFHFRCNLFAFLLNLQDLIRFLANG